MNEWKIYHNPRCSKSRVALSMLQNKGIMPIVVEYLKCPPSASEIKALLEILKVKPKEIVRTKEEVFSTLSIDLDQAESVAEAIAQHPVLLERPIVVNGRQAVIARPPERVEELF